MDTGGLGSRRASTLLTTLVSGGWGVPPQGCARADAALTVRQALVISWD